MFLSVRYNAHSYEVKKYIIDDGAVTKRYQSLIQCLRNNDPENSLMHLHLLVLLTQGSQKAIDHLEDTIDFDEII